MNLDVGRGAGARGAAPVERSGDPAPTDGQAPARARSARRTRVLLVSLQYAPEPTGIGPYVTALAEGLVERGFSARVLTTFPHYPHWRVAQGYGGWRRDERRDGVALVRVRHLVPREPRGVRRLLGELTFGLRAATQRWGAPDVVVVVSPGLFSLPPVLARARLSRGRPPVVTWVQDLYSAGVSELRQGGPAATAVARAESRILRSSDAVVTIHTRFAERLVGALRLELDRVHVIRNWSHVDTHDDAARAAEVRARRGWTGKVVALHAGAMGVKQGLENVVDAAQHADALPDDVVFVLMGDGSRRAALEQHAAGVGSVEFLDPVSDDEFMATLGCADVLLVNEVPALRETAVPSKLTSYFASGRPVVAATDAASVTAHEIEASGGGVRVAPGDPRALLEAVVALATDQEQAARLGRSGRAYRQAVLDQRAALDHYAQALAALAGARAVAGHARRRTGEP